VKQARRVTIFDSSIFFIQINMGIFDQRDFSIGPVYHLSKHTLRVYTVCHRSATTLIHNPTLKCVCVRACVYVPSSHNQ